jgi:transcriptional regulator with XRE-family HTH domain
MPWLDSYTRPGYCSYCGRWLGRDETSGQGSLSEENELFEEQLQVAISVGRVIAAPPDIEGTPAREEFANVINACIDATTNGNVADFSALIDVPYNTASNWKHGNSIPTIENLVNMCDRLNIPLKSVVECDCESIRTTLESVWVPNDATGRNHRKFEVDVQRIRSSLERIIAEEAVPPPSLTSVARDLGHDIGTIKGHCPKLSERISQRYWAFRRDKRVRARMILEAALRDDTEPPLSFTDVCLRNALDTRQMYEWFPEMSHDLAARYTAWLSRQAAIRKQTIRATVFDAVVAVHRAGEIPTKFRVFSAIKNPRCIPINPTFQRAFQDAIDELNIE